MCVCVGDQSNIRRQRATLVRCDQCGRLYHTAQDFRNHFILYILSYQRQNFLYSLGWCPIRILLSTGTDTGMHHHAWWISGLLVKSFMRGRISYKVRTISLVMFYLSIFSSSCLPVSPFPPKTQETKLVFLEFDVNWISCNDTNGWKEAWLTQLEHLRSLSRLLMNFKRWCLDELRKSPLNTLLPQGQLSLFVFMTISTTRSSLTTAWEKKYFSWNDLNYNEIDMAAKRLWLHKSQRELNNKVDLGSPNIENQRKPQHQTRLVKTLVLPVFILALSESWLRHRRHPDVSLAAVGLHAPLHVSRLETGLSHNPQWCLLILTQVGHNKLTVIGKGTRICWLTSGSQNGSEPSDFTVNKHSYFLKWKSRCCGGESREPSSGQV